MTTVGYLVIMGVCLVSYFSSRACYSNGVADGYGYSREPRNPGYAYAGLLLKKYSEHRFRELRENKSVVVTTAIDCCPSTGERDCRKCSGEYCNVHFSRPCDCDVNERHFIGQVITAKASDVFVNSRGGAFWRNQSDGS